MVPGEPWSLDDITFELLDDMSSDPTVTIVIGTPQGQVFVMGDYKRDGGVITLSKVHINGEEGMSANVLGMSNLRVLARAALLKVDCHELCIEGATRTSGAGPGRTPRPLRFRR